MKMPDQPHSDEKFEEGMGESAGGLPAVASVAEAITVLRARILDGTLGPGQRLIESDLTEMLGATRGAVRQALLRLESDGLVERERNRGAKVRKVSVDEAIEITEARAVLEGLCARKAAERITPEERASLMELGQQLQQAVEEGNIVGYSDLVESLHTRIQKLANQTTVAQLLERLRHQSIRHQFGVVLLPGRLHSGLRDHLSVIEAVCSGDPGEAESRMREHLGSVIEALPRVREPQRPLGTTRTSG